MGLLGVWVAMMTIDWAFRSICCCLRYRGHKWEKFFPVTGKFILTGKEENVHISTLTIHKILAGLGIKSKIEIQRRNRVKIENWKISIPSLMPERHPQTCHAKKTRNVRVQRPRRNAGVKR